MNRPLSGIRVVEFANFVAAPVAARLLADLGAEVIKVERPEGDAWRQTGIGYAPGRYGDDENPVFDIYNSGKKHVAINLKASEGMEAFHKLLGTADVLVTNTRPKALKKLGLSYEDLKEKYPRLVFAIVLGYGEQGPEKDKPAFDTSAFWARSGFLRDQALLKDNYDPVPPPFGVGDTITGYLLMGEICAALYRREKTGLGDYVRSSLLHNGIFTMGTMSIITQKPYGKVFPQDRAGFGAPSGAYTCADGEWIFISGYSSALYPRVYKMIDREDLAEDPLYCDAAGRWQNRYDYYGIIRDAFLQKPSAYWLEKAIELDIPMTRMSHYSDVTEDEQAWANGYLEHVQFRNGNVDVMPRSPIEMDSVGQVDTKTAPTVGADTDCVLESLGYSKEQVQAMHATGVIK